MAIESHAFSVMWISCVLRCAYCLRLRPSAAWLLLPASCFRPSASCSLFTAHCSLLTAHCSLLTAHCSLLTVHCSRPQRQDEANYDQAEEDQVNDYARRSADSD